MMANRRARIGALLQRMLGSPELRRRVLRRALCSGGFAAVTSTIALSLACRLRGRTLASGSNATSQWIWGRRAWRQQHGDLRHTLLGYLIHHASSVFWAVGYERWREAERGRARLPRALAVSAVAGAVDYLVVPRRMTPGFEAHLKPAQIPGVYLAFAVGLLLCPRRRG